MKFCEGLYMESDKVIWKYAETDLKFQFPLTLKGLHFWGISTVFLKDCAPCVGFHITVFPIEVVFGKLNQICLEGIHILDAQLFCCSSLHLLPLNFLCSAFYKNMVKVAKCVTYNKVSATVKVRKENLFSAVVKFLGKSDKLIFFSNSLLFLP